MHHWRSTFTTSTCHDAPRFSFSIPSLRIDLLLPIRLFGRPPLSLLHWKGWARSHSSWRSDSRSGRSCLAQQLEVRPHSAGPAGVGADALSDGSRTILSAACVRWPRAPAKIAASTSSDKGSPDACEADQPCQGLPAGPRSLPRFPKTAPRVRGRPYPLPNIIETALAPIPAAVPGEEPVFCQVEDSSLPCQLTMDSQIAPRHGEGASYADPRSSSPAIAISILAREPARWAKSLSSPVRCNQSNSF